jgi:hypothetical protein
MVDLEGGWGGITPLNDIQNFCPSLEKAAQIIRTHGAYAIFTTGGESLYPHRAECAARYAVWASPYGHGTVHVQSQPYENDPATFVNIIKENTAWARSVAPHVRISFGVTTNPRFSPTASTMFAAWQAGMQYLSTIESGPRCWLNIVPTVSADGTVDWSPAVDMASAFLSDVQGTS